MRLYFNGAGAGKLRKTPGPRFRSGAGQALQWGRSRKAPENGMILLVMHRLWQLQWGRSRKAPENESVPVEYMTCNETSMGPEPESSGKLGQITPFMGEVYALQWGRSRKAPENSSFWLIFAGMNTLQWGRSRKAPENLASYSNNRAEKPELQWGRSRKAPENFITSEETGKTNEYFNGAGAGKLRKTLSGHADSAAYTALQWGRSRKAPENSQATLLDNEPEKTSMGPEPESSGKRDLNRREQQRNKNFNGAGAGKLRKTARS